MGITKIVAVSMDQKTALQTLHITDRSKKENWPIAIYPAIGIHPWEAHKEFDKQMLIKALDQAENPIVGEIGLDHRFVPEKRWEKQRLVFQEMLQMAEDYSAPAIVHSKDAEAEVLDLLSSFAIPQIILHWYTGPLPLAMTALKHGYCFSVTPAIEYSHVLKNLAQNAPLKQLLLESDGPVGYRLSWGRILGTPSWVPMVARQICNLRANEGFDDLVQAIESNSAKLLGINA
jgi:TatD DNase family protein